MDAARPASELAADVLNDMQHFAAGDNSATRQCRLGRSRRAVDALVARVADLEAREEAVMFIAEDWKRQFNEAKAQVADLEARLRDEEMERGQFQRAYEDEKELREAAEAQVADLEAELTEWRTSIATEALTARAEAAEAQVAALTAEATAAEEARRVSDEAAATWATLLAEEQQKVAALTEERDEWEATALAMVPSINELVRHRKAAEAALANTRQALADLLSDIPNIRNAAAWQRVKTIRAAQDVLSAAGDNTTERVEEEREALRRIRTNPEDRWGDNTTEPA